MDMLELITGIGVLLAGMNLGVNVVWPSMVKHNINKNHKYALQAISKYDGFLINQEKFIDNASLYKVEVKNRNDLEKLLPYIEKIANHVGEENLKLLYTNLKTATIEKSKLKFGVTGDWNPIDKILLYKKIESLGHELLHVASSFYNELRDEVQCGFSQATADGDVEIGRGFNEGYTEYLTFKIFGEHKNSVYTNLVLIARLLELFFDDPREMEKFYFSHDLPGFIHYMEKFIPYDRMISIVLNLDKIYLYDDSFEAASMLEVVNVEMELYRYFVKSNPSSDKLRTFEDILREKKLSAIAFSQDKMTLIKENVKNDEEENAETIEEVIKMSV